MEGTGPDLQHFIYTTEQSSTATCFARAVFRHHRSEETTKFNLFKTVRPHVLRHCSPRTLSARLPLTNTPLSSMDENNRVHRARVLSLSDLRIIPQPDHSSCSEMVFHSQSQFRTFRPFTVCRRMITAFECKIAPPFIYSTPTICCMF